MENLLKVHELDISILGVKAFGAGYLPPTIPTEASAVEPLPLLSPLLTPPLGSGFRV